MRQPKTPRPNIRLLEGGLGSSTFSGILVDDHENGNDRNTYQNNHGDFWVIYIIII